MMPRGDSVYEMKDKINAHWLSIALIYEVRTPPPKKKKYKYNVLC